MSNFYIEKAELEHLIVSKLQEFAIKNGTDIVFECNVDIINHSITGFGAEIQSTTISNCSSALKSNKH